VQRIVSLVLLAGGIVATVLGLVGLVRGSRA
jgi:hypothetical protein